MFNDYFVIPDFQIQNIGDDKNINANFNNTKRSQILFVILIKSITPASLKQKTSV